VATKTPPPATPVTYPAAAAAAAEPVAVPQLRSSAERSIMASEYAFLNTLRYSAHAILHNSLDP
jgi:hypothetical protein